jgi:hypothetical protein
MASLFADGIDRHQHNCTRRKYRLAHGAKVTMRYA